jgi:hypothetical protein
MLSDGLTLKQSTGEARQEVEVLDVAQLLLASVKRSDDDPALQAEPTAAEAADPNTITSAEQVGALAAGAT